MRIEGVYTKEDKHWVISIPEIALFTQGKSKKDAFFMVQDAIRALLGDSEFLADVEDLGDGRFHFVSEDSARLFALVLKQGRLAKNLTHEEARKKIGAKSRSEFTTYEKGQTDPTLSKACRLLEAIGMSIVVVPRVMKKRE